jgi:uncharacterized membrane protein YoaK (UPF0700 family)
MGETPMTPRDALVVGSALAFTAGFADASTFVGADGVFCAHVTGNFVVLASDLARRADAGGWLKLSTFPVFVAAVLVTTWVSSRSSGPLQTSTMRRLLALKAVLLGAAAIVGAAGTPSRPGIARSTIVTLLVVAMGIQNTIHRLRPTLGVMTTVMTGNVTSWLTGVLLPAPVSDAPKRRALGLVIAFFAVGCFAGAAGVVSIGFGALAFPTAVALLTRSRIR